MTEIILDADRLYTLVGVLTREHEDRISQIKFLRDITGLSLKTAVSLVEAFHAAKPGPRHRGIVLAKFKQVEDWGQS